MSAISHESKGHARVLSFEMHDGTEVQVPYPRTPSPLPTPPLRDAFTTPPPRSVPMERTPPSPYRKLCLECADKAREFYNRAHADHAITAAMQRYTTVYDGTPVGPPTPPERLQANQVNRLNSIISQPPSPPNVGRQMWPDPFNGVM